MQVDIDGARLLRDLAELSTIGGRADGGVDRVAWSAADLEARAWLRRRIEEIGWIATTDAALNVYGRSSPERRRRLMIGSHTDSVPAGGRLDGAYGVVAALEVVRALAEAKDPVADHVELVDFADEEGVRFPCGYFGSKALAGLLDVDALRSLPGASGVLIDADVDLDGLPSANEHLGDVAGFLELHIEQGPRLEREGLAVAIVPGILGFDRYTILIEGRSAHGGTTPLDLRHDPVFAATVFVSEVPAIVRETGGESATATIGSIASTGGAINFVAESVRLTLEVRHPSAAGLATMVDVVSRRLAAVCEAYGCRATMERHDLAAETRAGVSLAVEPAYSAPVEFDPGMVDAVDRACDDAGVNHRVMPAGTWHDAGIMAAHVPTAMILVASRDGLTHCPAEASADGDLVAGARVLLAATRRAVSMLGLLAG